MGRLNNFFAEAVDETLKKIFKKDGAKVIYEFLETHSRLRLEDAADKPEVFSASLERLMVSAARVIEKAILKNLYSRARKYAKDGEDHGHRLP
jgi:aspartyl/asparaginyl beta-hydroxylase (cupin superfamily)